MDTPINNLIVGRAVEWNEPGAYGGLSATSYRGMVLAFELRQASPPEFLLLVDVKQVQYTSSASWGNATPALMTVFAMLCHFPTLEPDTEVKTDDTFRKGA